jgi:hypothetical protein
MHKGIAHPAAACKTDLGIAWVNRIGCYLYDGQRVQNLLEKGGRQMIRESEWLEFTTDDSIIGYFPKKRQIFVVESCAAVANAGNVYIFDIVTQSWVKGDSLFTDSQLKTNFITDWSNDLVYAHSASGTVLKWNDVNTVSDPTNFSLKTRDIDFGQPAQRKKIYKVYVSYKGDGDSVTVQYAVNGDTDTVAPFYRTNADGSSDGSNSDTTPLLDSDTDDWISAELKPVSSISSVKSIQLVFGGTIGMDFEINDITIIYRLKGIK